MNSQKILEVIAVYRKYFEKNNIPKSDFPHDQLLTQYGCHASELALSHCHGMLDKMEQFIAQGRLEKAFRWLGFIQGTMWLSGCFTLEDLKNHSRPDSA